MRKHRFLDFRRCFFVFFGKDRRVFFSLTMSKTVTQPKNLKKKRKTVKEFLTVFVFFELVFSGPSPQNTFFFGKITSKNLEFVAHDGIFRLFFFKRRYQKKTVKINVKQRNGLCAYTLVIGSQIFVEITTSNVRDIQTVHYQ